MEEAKILLTLIEDLSVLKRLPRAGWRLRGIKDCESVADHCFRMSTLAMIIADMLVASGVELDSNKVVRMALLHEFGEARIGDIPFPAFRHFQPDFKRNAELHAVEEMLEPLGKVGKDYLELWKEFEEGDTIEGKIVRAVDKLEMMIQAGEYEAIGYRCLNEFWTNASTIKDFTVHPIFREVMEILISRRYNAKS
jgi:putative hydrolases of HD superfamily